MGINSRDCAICGKANGYQAGGWLCMRAGEGLGFACQGCTSDLVAAWAREFRRRALETPPTPTPTAPPSGDTEAPLLAVAA